MLSGPPQVASVPRPELGSAAPAQTSAERWWWLAVAAGATALLAYAAVPQFRGLVAGSLSLAPTAAVLFAVRRYRPAGARAWLVFATGSTLAAVGSIAATLGVVPSPPGGDAVGFVIGAGQAIQLLGLARARARGAALNTRPRIGAGSGNPRIPWP
ncbi:MAG: hypothetical protein M3406_00160 [Chloroflexota bacterium]|nr:hypothetical protein [Chloroflexota bacterium]